MALLQFRSRLLFAFVLTVFVLTVSQTAFAAFEWRGPLAPPAPPAPAPKQMPAAENPAPAVPLMQKDSLAPVIMWDGQDSSAPVPDMPAVKAEPVMQQPMIMEPVEQLPPLEDEESFAGETVLAGFGSDLPLVIALRQIIPPMYKMSFARNVNPGVRVSWQGGKPWEMVLSDMLKAHDLFWALHGKTVVVGTGAVRQVMAHDHMPDHPHEGQVVDLTTAIEAVPAAPAMPEVSIEKPMAVVADTSDMEMPVMPKAEAEVAAAVSAPQVLPETLPMPEGTLKTEERKTHRLSPGARILLGRTSATGVKEDFGALYAQKQDSAIQAQQAQMVPPAMQKMSDDVKKPSMQSAQLDRSKVDTQKTEMMQKRDEGVDAPVQIRRRKPSSLLERMGVIAPRGASPQVEHHVTTSQSDSDMTKPPLDLTAPKDMNAGAKADMQEGAVQNAMEKKASPAQAEKKPAKSASMSDAWGAKKGQTLRDVLNVWSTRADVELYWSIDYDYKLVDDVAYNGGFDDAVSRLFESFSHLKPQPYGSLYKDEEQKKILVVKSYDLTDQQPFPG